jgi:hypothetical protein
MMWLPGIGRERGITRTLSLGLARFPLCSTPLSGSRVSWKDLVEVESHRFLSAQECRRPTASR